MAEYKQQAWDETTENVFQRQVERDAKQAGWSFYHTEFSIRSEAGYPDLHLFRGGDEFYVELKTEFGKMTEKQKEWRDRIIAAGGEWHLWRPSNADEIFDRLNVDMIPDQMEPHLCGEWCNCEPVRKKPSRKRKVSQ